MQNDINVNISWIRGGAVAAARVWLQTAVCASTAAAATAAEITLFNP